MITIQEYNKAQRVIKQYEAEQLDSLRVRNSSKQKLKEGDEVDLDMGEGKIAHVSVSKITPHDSVPNSMYYEFSNGAVCRDIRLN
jgi:hypothetical protein